MQDFYPELPCFTFCICIRGLIAGANAALCHRLGYEAQEITGMKAESIFTLSTRIFQQTHLFPLLELKGHAGEIYITLRARNGHDIPVLMNVVRTKRDENVFYLFAGISVEKRKKFEEEIIAAKNSAENALKENTVLKLAQDELQKHAEKLDIQIDLARWQNQELRQFSHLTTHSLQEPLRKLMLFCSPRNEEVTENGRQINIGKIRTAAEDLNRKLKGLQQLDRLINTPLDFKETNMELVLRKVISELAMEYPEVDIKLKTEPIPPLETDLIQVHILLKELVKNAVHFRKPGRELQLQVYASTLMKNKFRQLTGKYKYVSFVKLVIEDDGAGFDDHYQLQAFELFRKLNPSAGAGAGIGLSLCKKIVENHSGSISLESKRQVGTKVIIFLPQAQDKLPL